MLRTCIAPAVTDGIIIHTASTFGPFPTPTHVLFSAFHVHALNSFLHSAYAAYIAGILINIVGFAGASRYFSLPPRVTGALTVRQLAVQSP